MSASVGLLRRYEIIKGAAEDSKKTSVWFALGMAWMAALLGSRGQFNVAALSAIEFIKEGTKE